MAVQELNFQGINRAITDYAVTGACEELINLRPTSGGLVPVKDFTVKMQDFPYDAVYVHYAGGATNYIAIYCGADGHVDIIHIAEDGSTILPIVKTFYFSAVISNENIHFAQAGNYVLISIKDEDNSIFQNAFLFWNGENYIVKDTAAPSVSFDVVPGQPSLEETAGQVIASDATELEMTDIINSAFNAIQEKHDNLCFGAILIALAIKTKDGEIAFTSNWKMYNPVEIAKTAQPSQGTAFYDYLVDTNWAWASYFPNFFATYDEGFQVVMNNAYRLAGVPVKINITLNNTGWNSDNSIFESVEVYVSRPCLYADPSKLFGEMAYYTPAQTTAQPHVLLPEVPIEMMELEDQLLFHQKSVPLTQLASGAVEVELTFGGNIQTTNDTLEVDAGNIERFGNVLSYNSRFHFYDNIAKVGLSMPFFSYKSGLTTATYHVLISYYDGQKDRTVWVGDESLPSQMSGLYSGMLFILTDSINVNKVILVRNQGTHDLVATYPMTQSPRYNCSYYYGSSAIIGMEDEGIYDDVINAGQKAYLYKDEPNAINVSEQYNPFVFDVDHSYLAPGKVLDVQPQMVAVRDVTFGDYPLNVFTDRGTYALLQGNGQVLYGNFRSMSNLVSTANSVPTEHGTFFLAAGGLWAVAGSDAILISDALHLGPHKYIRDCAGYQTLSASGTGYNVSNYVSEVSFEEFTRCAKLSYNRFRDELIVSSNIYRYSYVLSLKYRQWFKIDRSLFQDNVGVNIAKLGNKPVVVAVNSSLAVIHTTGTILYIHYVFNVQRESGLYTPVEVTLDLTEVTNPDEIEGYLEAALSHATPNILSGTTVSVLIDDSILKAQFYLPTTITGRVKGYSESLSAINPYSPTRVDSTSNMIVSRTTEVIDFSEETDGSVRAHLQSRPFSFNGFGYSHVHRIVDMVRTALAGSNKLIVALYGSDDLQNWTLLSYGARTAPYGATLKISQLRTPPAARSWRYYTVCIGGTVPTDTDFGPVLVDYEPVIRRLG